MLISCESYFSVDPRKVNELPNSTVCTSLSLYLNLVSAYSRLLSFLKLESLPITHWQILLILMSPFFLLSSYFFISRDLTFMPMTLFTGVASQFLGVFYDLSLTWKVSTYEHGPWGSGNCPVCQGLSLGLGPLSTPIISREMETLMTSSTLPPLFADEDGSKESNDLASTG